MRYLVILLLISSCSVIELSTRSKYLVQGTHTIRVEQPIILTADFVQIGYKTEIVTSSFSGKHWHRYQTNNGYYIYHSDKRTLERFNDKKELLYTVIL